MIAVWPAALIDSLHAGAAGARAGVLTATLAAPLAVAGLLHLSWRSYARARTGRCADFMLLALALTIGICAALFGLGV